MVMLAVGVVIGITIGATALMVSTCCYMSNELECSMEKWRRDNDR